MKTTTLNLATGGVYRDVILTAGGLRSTGEQIFGIFFSEDDARSMDADLLAHGTIGADQLTAEQIELAEANSDELCD